MIVTTTATSKAIVSDWVYPPDGRRSCNGPPSRRPRRYLGRGRNRRNSNQPMRPAVSNTNTGHRIMPAAMIRHCFQIEPLPMAGGPRRTSWTILRSDRRGRSWRWLSGLWVVFELRRSIGER